MNTTSTSLEYGIDQAVKQLKRSERGQRALRALVELMPKISGLDSGNQNAVLLLVYSSFENPSTTREALGL
jgi:hypothetical protein